MTRRRVRGHGEGTISRRKDGRWEVRYQVGVDGHGKRIRRTAYARTKREALRKLDDMRAQLREHGRVASAGRMRFGDFLDVWLKVKQGELRESPAGSISFATVTGRSPGQCPCPLRTWLLPGRWPAGSRIMLWSRLIAWAPTPPLVPLASIWRGYGARSSSASILAVC